MRAHDGLLIRPRPAWQFAGAEQQIRIDIDPDCMRNWTTGVTLIAIAGEEGPTGMTVNSLTPVSLHSPLLLFCAATTRIMRDDRSVCQTGTGRRLTACHGCKEQMQRSSAGSQPNIRAVTTASWSGASNACSVRIRPQHPCCTTAANTRASPMRRQIPLTAQRIEDFCWTG